MKLTVIGTGYVGLVSGACLAEMGNTVVCVDTDDGKIEALKRGELPIYEPGLERIVVENSKEGRLHFTSSLADPLAQAQVYFIAVGTPPRDDGSADLTQVLDVAKQLGQLIQQYTVIVDKSTVPVGTAERVQTAVQQELQARGADVSFDVLSNPEFLKEGAAINDFMKPDRIVIGEVRGAESLDMLQAMNTGHDGSLTTVHANTPRDALSRVETMVAMAGLDMPQRSVRSQIASAIDVVIQLSRLSDGRRKLVSLQEITGMEGEIVTMQEIFTFERLGIDADGNVLGDIVPTGVRPKFAENLKLAGYTLPANLFDRHPK